MKTIRYQIDGHERTRTVADTWKTRNVILFVKAQGGNLNEVYIGNWRVPYKAPEASEPPVLSRPIKQRNYNDFISKVCATCGEEKGPDDFYLRHASCKVCVAEHRKEKASKAASKEADR